MGVSPTSLCPLKKWASAPTHMECRPNIYSSFCLLSPLRAAAFDLSRNAKRAPVRWFYETNKPTLLFSICCFSDANHLGSALPAASKIRRKRSVRIHINLLKKLQKSCEICNFTAFRGGPEGIRTFDLSDANELKALICIDFYPFPPLFPGM